MNARAFRFDEEGECEIYFAPHAENRILQRAPKMGWDPEQLKRHIWRVVSRVNTAVRIPATGATPGYARYRCGFSAKIDGKGNYILIVFEEHLYLSIRVVVTIYVRREEKIRRHRRRPN